MKNRWDPSSAPVEGGLPLLVYVTRLLGAEENLVLHGGGNTSAKFTEADLRGRSVRVLRIKGSGWDLKTIEAAGFAPCRQEDLEPLLDQTEELDDAGMVDYVAATLLDPKAPRPSIETLLHAFVPQDWILHSHSDAILTLTNSAGRESTVREALGDDVAIVGYRRPGHRLSQDVGQAYRSHPNSWGVVLMNHGLVTWGATAQEAYDRHIALVTRAEEYLQQRSAFIPVEQTRADGELHFPSLNAMRALAPRLRGLLSRREHMVLHLEASELIGRFTDDPEVESYSQQGTATPDHLLFTKRVPLLIPRGASENPQLLADALERYTERYAAEYQQSATGEFDMLDPHPRVILAGGVGCMVTVGRNVKEARRIADIYRHTMPIILGAEHLGGYRSLAPADAHHAEYWPLELYKRTLAPKPVELEGHIALVTGAGSGIGKAIALRLAQAGAHVSCCDLDATAARLTAAEINQRHGTGRALGITCDVGDESQVIAAVDRTVLEWGGLDIVISNAGVIVAGEIADLTLANWERAFRVNATGHFLVCREALKVFREQGLGGSIVLNCSKNVPLPGGGFGAYSASKAAETQLGRILAIEGAPLGVRVNMLHPDGIFAGSQLWNAEIRQQRAEAYGVAPEELPEFYRQRNLLRVGVTPEDVAEAALFFVSPRSRATTGGVLTVDGGLPGAFSR
ncbi:MAG: 3-phenylpropionate-dihydrodiol/cinnamic acid-dihydrodiol dehydrogenase [bacterium]|nr:3-phenylpropionate-dihydrodiol/cinnamic acid-dihydrodiol dehydrogenase [bacterium]